MNASKRKGTADSLAERLWRRVHPMPNGCWEWCGYIRPHGYGQIGAGRRSEGVIDTHRAAWIVTHGPIPDGLWVLHHCDNRPCVNPAHLYLGTSDDNIRDMVQRGRARGAEGLANWNGRLTDEQVAEIRALYRSGVRATALASEYGITRQYVGQLARGLWRKKA